MALKLIEAGYVGSIAYSQSLFVPRDHIMRTTSLQLRETSPACCREREHRIFFKGLKEMRNDLGGYH